MMRERPWGVLRRRSHIILITCLLAGALVLRLPGITEPSIEQRETQSALLARQWYLSDRSQLPAWQQRVLRDVPNHFKPIEPPVLDFLASLEFRLSGENFWFPRLISSLLWVVGGIFLYLIATRLTTREGSLIALALYLTWPFAVWLSRHFMPDAFMVSLLLAASLTVIRYWEQPSLRRFTFACVVSALATAVKPGVAFAFLVALFVALALSRRELRRTLLRQLPVFVGLTASVAVGYYVAGTYVSHFIWSEASSERVTPHLLLTAQAWKGMWNAVSYLLRYPQDQSLLALVPLAAGLAGIIVAPRGTARAVLLGLSLGYVAFAITFVSYTSGNPYYSLPLIPILALSIGVLAGFLLQRASPVERGALLALVVTVIGIASYKSFVVLGSGSTAQRISDYRRIGEITGHTTHALIVDNELSTPSMYWGWITGGSWDLARDYPPPWSHPEKADFLIVVGARQLEAAQVQAFVRGLPVVAKTNRYAIFDLRGGHVRARAAHGAFSVPGRRRRTMSRAAGT